MPAEALAPSIDALLSASGAGTHALRLTPLSAGGNNRVFMVQTERERLAAKWYYHDPADPRDRLGAEYGFVEHAWRAGVRCVPRPRGCDPTAHVALYEFIEGERPESSRIDGPAVMEAAAFIVALNSRGSRALAAGLPAASEACFSVLDHLRMVDGRVARLAQIRPEHPIDADAARFTRRLAAGWEAARGTILAGCESLGVDPGRQLALEERCLSPSDFGFHNALRRADGSLCFIDFEYAGWDDPAKTVGDFFSHPGVPVPRAHFDPFLAALMSCMPDSSAAAARARLLEPLFRLKWCCIILNEFLPDAARRRRFADPRSGGEARKASQLAKAVALFESLENPKEP
jgi:phosphotransferase family enzyme